LEPCRNLHRRLRSPPRTAENHYREVSREPDEDQETHPKGVREGCSSIEAKREFLSMSASLAALDEFLTFSEEVAWVSFKFERLKDPEIADGCGSVVRHPPGNADHQTHER